MTYGNLTEVQRCLRELLAIKQARVDDLRAKLSASPEVEQVSGTVQELQATAADCFNIRSLSSIIRSDIDRLQGVGPGDLLARIDPKSAMLSAIEEISEELRCIASTIDSYILTSNRQNERSN